MQIYESESLSVLICVVILSWSYNQFVLWWMWTCLLNDPTGYSSHHFPGPHPSGWRCLIVHIAHEWHVVGIWGYDGTSASNNVWITCVDNGILLVRGSNLIFIFILTWNLLLIREGDATASNVWLLLRWRVLDKLSHSYALLRALSVNVAHIIDVRLPIILLNRRLRLPCLLLLLDSLVIAVWLWTETVVVCQQLILHLLNVVATSSVSSLRVVIVLSLIWIIWSISLLLLYHASQLLIVGNYSVVSLLLHLLV